jgi:hypothetical protein
MDYHGKYAIFDARRIRTYPISERLNKVKLSDIMDPDKIRSKTFEVDAEIERSISEIAGEVLSARKKGKPVILFTGAHLIKNGLGRVVIDLVRRGTITLVGGNGATAIHDFELAMIGETSEHVPQALEKGQFGMAQEFACHNVALSIGNRHQLGYGETLGKTICDASFRREVFALAADERAPVSFRHPEISVLAACYEQGVPFTVHAGIGTDVTDQHPSFNGEAKGGVSARDFLVFVDEVAKMTRGGVVLNVGSAVTGPEVLLKAVSMASNAGKPPNSLITADFDLRARQPQNTDESKEGYYYRDQKSVVSRIPASFHGKGYYIQGNQKTTIPLLYQKIMEQP